ncbi:MAG: hypothetical protein JNL39_11810 [Opitutaceae bacterium]|nr:hypothetical protein [Opitutaceae bacterium]
MLNLQIAKAYLMGADRNLTSRTWKDALDQLIGTKHGSNRDRWLRAAKDRAFTALLPLVIIETTADVLLRVLRAGRVSTNVHLRRLHNFCVDMGFLPWPILPKRQWPALRHKPKRAVQAGEHTRIVARELNPERKVFYQLAWHLAPSQTDLANLDAADIDWPNRIVSFFRKKTGSLVQIRFGDEVAAVLRSLPQKGPLFPYLRSVDSRARANEFRERCRGLGIKGISLHSYRYSWAERAKAAGYPERYAQLALGHKMRTERVGHLREPGAVLCRFLHVRRRKVFHAVWRGIAKGAQQARRDQDRNIVGRAVEHPRGLFCGQPCRRSAQQAQKAILLFSHPEASVAPVRNPSVLDAGRELEISRGFTT